MQNEYRANNSIHFSSQFLGRPHYCNARTITFTKSSAYASEMFIESINDEYWIRMGSVGGIMNCLLSKRESWTFQRRLCKFEKRYKEYICNCNIWIIKKWKRWRSIYLKNLWFLLLFISILMTFNYVMGVVQLTSCTLFSIHLFFRQSAAWEWDYSDVPWMLRIAFAKWQQDVCQLFVSITLYISWCINYNDYYLNCLF